MRRRVRRAAGSAPGIALWRICARVDRGLTLDRWVGIGTDPRRTICFRELGEKGQLGNQLWQIASTLGLAASRGANAAFPPWSYRDHFSVPDGYFSDGPVVGEDAWALAGHIPPAFHHYLQDHGLWRDIEALVRGHFEPSGQSAARMREKFSEFLKIPDKTAVHVRRGDYLKWPTHHPVATQGYYRDALAMLPSTNVVVFSDDIVWCRENLAWANPVAFMDGNEDYEDLYLISQCDHHVMANSSFSWWGAFLSRNQRPIYPVRWYGSRFQELGIDPTLMWIKGWIGIDA